MSQVGALFRLQHTPTHMHISTYTYNVTISCKARVASQIPTQFDEKSEVVVWRVTVRLRHCDKWNWKPHYFATSEENSLYCQSLKRLAVRSTPDLGNAQKLHRRFRQLRLLRGHVIGDVAGPARAGTSLRLVWSLATYLLPPAEVRSLQGVK